MQKYDIIEKSIIFAEVIKNGFIKELLQHLLYNS